MGTHQPRIGITCSIDYLSQPSGEVSQRLRLNMAYIDAVLASGGLAVPLAPVKSAEMIARQIDGVDGLILTGGPDLPPHLYGQPQHALTVPICQRRSEYDFAILAEADKKDLPVLAICLGHQILNVYRGGTLIQHLGDTARSPQVQHSGNGYLRHSVRSQAGTLLHRIIPKATFEVSTSHHQAVDRIGSGLVATAWAQDDVVEAMEDPNRSFLVGVQWHPEVVADMAEHAALFRAFTEVSQNR